MEACMSVEMMNTREVAEYLGINEKQVYALIKAGRIPCTRVTGKWLFPRSLIDRWINASAGGRSVPDRGPDRILAAGSNDPVLDLLLGSANNYAGALIFSCNLGSVGGLRLLEEGRCDLAWCHLYDSETGTYNIPYIASHLADKRIAVVHLFYREIGILMSADASKRVKRFEDIASGIRFINRQKGSGIRIFVDHNLKKSEIDPTSIDGYENEAYTHFEIGLSILSGGADAGISSVAISRLLGLPFIPLARESFDMVVGKDAFFEKPIQAFIETLRTKQFRKRVAHMGEYDFKDSGNIIYQTGPS
jgi:putative molybdopterin biosynthesis protein